MCVSLVFSELLAVMGCEFWLFCDLGMSAFAVKFINFQTLLFVRF